MLIIKQLVKPPSTFKHRLQSLGIKIHPNTAPKPNNTFSSLLPLPFLSHKYLHDVYQFFYSTIHPSSSKHTYPSFSIYNTAAFAIAAEAAALAFATNSGSNKIQKHAHTHISTLLSLQKPATTMRKTKLGVLFNFEETFL